MPRNNDNMGYRASDDFDDDDDDRDLPPLPRKGPECPPHVILLDAAQLAVQRDPTVVWAGTKPAPDLDYGKVAADYNNRARSLLEGEAGPPLSVPHLQTCEFCQGVIRGAIAAVFHTMEHRPPPPEGSMVAAFMDLETVMREVDALRRPPPNDQ